MSVPLFASSLEPYRARLDEARTADDKDGIATITEDGTILDTWLADNADGIACVIGDPDFPATSRVRSLTPVLSKGLEFDGVVVVEHLERVF